MDGILEQIFNNAQSYNQKNFETALSDLRYIIERFTQNRYSEEELSDYFATFYNKSLIDYRLDNESLKLIKFFLFFILMNFPDRAVLVAKCIKVLFDDSIREAICAGIEVYLRKDDHTTCELIFAITDMGDEENYLLNKRIVDVFKEVSRFGGPYSKKAVDSRLINVNYKL